MAPSPVATEEIDTWVPSSGTPSRAVSTRAGDDARGGRLRRRGLRARFGHGDTRRVKQSCDDGEGDRTATLSPHRGIIMPSDGRRYHDGRSSAQAAGRGDDYAEVRSRAVLSVLHCDLGRRSESQTDSSDTRSPCARTCRNSPMPERILAEAAQRREAAFQQSVSDERSRGAALSKRFEEALRQAEEEPRTRPRPRFRSRLS